MQTLTGYELEQLCNTTSLLVTVGDMYICEQDWLSQSNKINKELETAKSLEEIKAVLTKAIGKNFHIDEDKLINYDKYIEVRGKVMALVGEIKFRLSNTDFSIKDDDNDDFVVKADLGNLDEIESLAIRNRTELEKVKKLRSKLDKLFKDIRKAA